MDERELIKRIPKVELHMHVEGSMQPELMWKLAKRNNHTLPYSNIDEIKKAYKFKNLTEFIEIFIQGTEVVYTEQDLYDIAMEYFQLCHRQNIVHTEVHCDIRTYVDKGLGAEMVIHALSGAFKDAKSEYNITGGFMPCFLRHLGPDVAKQDWELLKPFKDQITAIGLSAIEVGYPPSLFIDVFNSVREAGVKIIAHAGEEAGPEYIWSAINDIKVDRIDHGIQCLKDERLVEHLQETQIPLTVCPQSNVSLKIFSEMKDHVLPLMLKKGLNVSIHSDDPAHFDSYLTENILSIYDETSVTFNDVIQMNRNAIQSSFASESRKSEIMKQLDDSLISLSTQTALS
jgi:adenosine deaminase